MGGRGRGIAAFSFNVDALGITRGSMPESRVGPNALFPNTEFKAVPLKAGEDVDYMLALKQELRGAMKIRPHYIKPMSAKADVERYKERYLKQRLAVDDAEWTPDWNLFPKELRPQKKKPRPKPGPTKITRVKITRIESEQVLKKLDELEKKGDGKDEKSDDEKEGVEKEKKKDGEEGEEEDIDEEELDEEDVEEENDYIDNYFDNGEEFGGAGSDDNMDAEATYN